MKKHWPDTRIKLSSNSFNLHKDLVLAGLGTSILPKFLINDDLKNGKLTTLMNEEKFIFDLKIITSKNQENDYKKIIEDLVLAL